MEGGLHFLVNFYFGLIHFKGFLLSNWGQILNFWICCLFIFLWISFFFLENIMKKACVKMNGFLLYCEVFHLSCSFLNEFFYTITWINVARYLTVSLRGPVRTLRRRRQPEFAGWTDCPSKGSFNFFIFRYIKGEVKGNNNIGIKKCPTIFMWE